MEFKKAFDYIVGKVEEELVKQNYTKQRITNGRSKTNFSLKFLYFPQIELEHWKSSLYHL